MISRWRLWQGRVHALRRVRWQKWLHYWQPVEGSWTWRNYRKLTKGCSCYACGNPRKWWGLERARDKREMERCDYSLEEGE